MRVQQSATQALDILRQAEASGREVTVNKRGEVAFAGRATIVLENLRGKFNGQEWKAARQVERHQQVLDAFGTALSRDFQPDGGNVKLAKAYEGVVKHIGYTFKDDYRNGVLPQANVLASEIATSLSEALGKYDKRQNDLAQRALTEFLGGTPPQKTQDLLDEIAQGRAHGATDGRVELDALRQALSAKTEQLGEAYAKASDPSDEQASELRDHVRALANLSAAVEAAVQAGRQVGDSRIPEFDSGNGRGDFGTVRFAGADSPKHQVHDAADGDGVRELRKSKIGKDLQSLFTRGLENRASDEFASSQTLGEGAGLRGVQERSKADVVAANRLWSEYEEGPVDEVGEPETRTVAEYAREEVSSKDANAYKTRKELKQAAQLAALEAQAAGVDPSQKKAPQRPIPADAWILGVYDKAGPILTAINASPLKDDLDLRGRVINAFTNTLIRESDASFERRVVGYTADEINAMAKATVDQFVKA
jgi:hypothetical protein